MLQQTQAVRVIPKYEQWLDTFPSFESLADANKKAVLKLWQGLGYNRRANYLYQSAHQVVSQHDGQLPKVEGQLKGLPGVGPYTAGALQAFCFDRPVVFVETNIRTVFIHHFFVGEAEISDQDIKKLVAETLPDANIREWYWGLMDYGNHLKQTVGNLNQRSNSYQTQSTFDGSNRQLRSAILRHILDNEPVSQSQLKKAVTHGRERQKSLEKNLDDLVNEGMIAEDENTYRTAE